MAHNHESGNPYDYLGPAHKQCNQAEALGRGVTWPGAPTLDELLRQIRQTVSAEHATARITEQATLRPVSPDGDEAIWAQPEDPWASDPPSWSESREQESESPRDASQWFDVMQAELLFGPPNVRLASAPPEEPDEPVDELPYLLSDEWLLSGRSEYEDDPDDLWDTHMSLHDEPGDDQR